MNVLAHLDVIPVAGVALAVAGTSYAADWSVRPGRAGEERRQQPPRGFRAGAAVDARAWPVERQLVRGAHARARGPARPRPHEPVHRRARPGCCPSRSSSGPAGGGSPPDEHHDPRVREQARYGAASPRTRRSGPTTSRAARYHEAVSQFDTPPGTWFNAPSYRLLGVERRADGGFALRVGTTTYWDGYALLGRAPVRGPPTSWRNRAARRPAGGRTGRPLGTPFAPGQPRLRDRDQRPDRLPHAPAARSSTCSDRAAARVATMPGVWPGPGPAEFQPAEVGGATSPPAALRRRRRCCVMREFAEEILGRRWHLNEQRGALGGLRPGVTVPRARAGSPRTAGCARTSWTSGSTR